MNKKIAVSILSIIILIVFCILALPAYITMTTWGYATPSTQWYEALLWIKNNTETDSIILAWWDYGYWIEYIAQREPVVTPSQEVDMIQAVAKYLMSYDSPKTPGGANYVIIDKNTSSDYLPAVINWAGYHSDYEIYGSLAQRLYANNAPASYQLVFDNGVKVFMLEDLEARGD